MGNNKPKGLFDNNWHKSPNAMVDLVMGATISPNAGWVVMTIIRYTQGMGDKRSAAIPTGTFKRVLGIKRSNTIYSIVNEAISSGLINAEKSRGCVTVYSVNEDCELWRSEPVAITATSGDNRNTTSGDKRHRVVAESATPVVAESATLIKRDFNKDFIKEQQELEIFNKSYEVIKNQLKMGGIIPPSKPVIDDQLQPEVYKFLSWCNEKGIAELQRSRQLIQWFTKIEFNERKRYYTPPDDISGRYYNPDDYEKTVPATEEEMAATRAKYAGALGM